MRQYIGIPYNLMNRGGMNCWSYIAHVYEHEKDQQLNDYLPDSEKVTDVASTFSKAFISGSHGFNKIDKPQNFDVIVFSRDIKVKERITQHYHCGIYFNGAVLHCCSNHGQSVYEPIKSAMTGFQEVTFWRK